MTSPVYLTLDDGPDPRWTPKILDVLSAVGVRATFFVIGNLARRHAALVRRASAEGHEIANHTLDHRHPWTLSATAARRQVREGAVVLADILGYAPRLYRAPHGRQRACMIEEAMACGERPVHWHLSAVDWGPLGTSRRIARRLQRVRANDIVLMHDGCNRHNRPGELLQVLPGFLDELARRGLQPALL